MKCVYYTNTFIIINVIINIITICIIIIIIIRTISCNGGSCSRRWQVVAVAVVIHYINQYIRECTAEFNACWSNPCQNEGTCEWHGDSHVCRCTAQFIERKHHRIYRNRVKHDNIYKTVICIVRRRGEVVITSD